jgi:RNA polymerase sigma-70 factor (ECF subfamily)
MRKSLSDPSFSGGLEAVFLENREKLLRFLAARGAGEAAEDLLHELWLRISGGARGPVASPLSYLFRAADTLMIDRYRSRVQAEKREREWSETAAGAEPGISDSPSIERQIIGRQHARLVEKALGTMNPRAAAIFRRHRMDGIPQRLVAEEMGVSLSTVESDLRGVYLALAELKERLDEA